MSNPAPVRRPRVLRVPGARANRTPRGGPDSAGPGGPRGEIDAPEDDQAAHPQPARAQQVVPGARVCRQRVPAARVGREARGRHDSACPGGPSDEQGASEDDQATRSARAPSLRTRRRCAATPGRARLDRPRWGGWARAENRQAWRRPDDLGHGLAVSSAWRPRCHWCSRLASTGGARLYGPSPGPCLAQLVRSRLPSAPPSSRHRPTAPTGGSVLGPAAPDVNFF